MAALMVVISTNQVQVVTEKIPVRYAQPTDVIRLIKSADPGQTGGRTTRGIASIVAYNLDRQIVVTGTREAVERVTQVIGLLDIAPKPVRVQLLLVRRSALPDGRLDLYVIASPVVETPSNSRITLGIADPGGTGVFEIAITPRLNGDASVSILADLNLASSLGTMVRKRTGNRRIAQGEQRTVTALLDSQPQREMPGADPLTDTLQPGIYLEVRPLAIASEGPTR